MIQHTKLKRSCWMIAAAESEQRIDNFLFRTLKKIPKDLIYRLLRKGAIRVNRRSTPASYKLQAGDCVEAPLLQEAAAPAAVIKRSESLPVLYEDSALLVINKPSGLAVHGGSGVSYGVIEQLRQGAYPYLELVHRLDKQTSGVLLLAKSRSSLRHLHEQWRQQQIQKCYWALVRGAWPPQITTVNAPLKKRTLKDGGQYVSITPRGKAAITEVKILERFANQATLLLVTPKTGRTHQIRVHTQHQGHPILGDSRYGSLTQEARLYLHATAITVVHPKNGKRIQFEAPVDALWQLQLQRLRNNVVTV